MSLPATSASVERSFSALKRIKNLARNTTCQPRLNNVSTISIEKELVKSLAKTSEFFDHVIDHFASIKERHIELIYKHL